MPRRRAARAVGLLDLTSLTGDEDDAAIRALCDRARAPGPGLPTVAAVCVLPDRVPLARAHLRGSPVRVATVAGGFPAGTAPLAVKLEEIRAAIAAGAGADEVDVVVDRRPLGTGNLRALYDEVAAFRGAAGTATLKVILETGALEDTARVEEASRAALLGGADFLKTSTGFAPVNATLAAGVAMARALAAFRRLTGRPRGLKASGGIRTAEEAADWLLLARACLGGGALAPGRFRFGASSLLDALVAAAGNGRFPLPSGHI